MLLPVDINFGNSRRGSVGRTQNNLEHDRQPWRSSEGALLEDGESWTNSLDFPNRLIRRRRAGGTSRSTGPKLGQGSLYYTPEGGCSGAATGLQVLFCARIPPSVESAKLLVQD
ncbi:hypothetical protein KM043_004204 [Ampulex compressa]|nr:hypothetical protein KM043_004204 [Ampulex compressa]